MAENSITRRWHDETAWSSDIKDLVFDEGKHWKKCIVSMRNEQNARIKTKVSSDNTSFPEESWSGSGKKDYSIDINKTSLVKVTGVLEKNNKLSGTGIGEVLVTCTYDEGSNSVTRVWHDRAAIKSNIENLVFPADQSWKKCTVLLEGHENDQRIDIKVSAGGKEVGTGFLDGKGAQTFEWNINAKCKIEVTGALQKTGGFPHGVGGKVTVVCTC